MASLAQSIFSATTLLVCLGLLPGASSAMVGILMILALFLVFLAPFDRHLLERYIQRVGAASLASSARSTKRMTGNEFAETPISGGPYTRQLCKMLDLEVVSFARRKFFLGAYLVELAIGRWNDDAREFEVVTEWCETWEGLEEEARQAMKSFRGIATPK
jgi:hypothetical protein